MRHLSRKHALVLAGLSAAMAVLLGFLPMAGLDLKWLYTRSVYYFQWATYLLLFLALRDDAPAGGARLKARLASSWPAVLLALTLTAVLFLGIEPDFRVLADESNLISTSHSLHLDRTLLNIVQGETYYGYWHTIESAVPTRPAGFPFLVSLVHSVLGFNPDHGLALNFIVSVLLLVLMIQFGRSAGAPRLGGAAAVLLAAFPLYGLAVTSNGYDALNLFFIMAIFAKMHDFLKTPDSRALEVLLLLALLGSQVRPETVVLLAPVGIAVWWKRSAVLASPISWRVPILPLLFLPIPWQRRAMGIATLQQDGRTDVFQLSHVLPNLKGLCGFFLNPWRPDLPRSEIVVTLALVGFVFFLIRALRGRLSRPVLETAALALLGLALITIVRLCFFLGDVSMPHAMRMGLVYVGFIAVLGAYPLHRAMTGMTSRAAIVFGLAALLFHSLPVAAHNHAGKSLTLFREFKEARNFLRDQSRPLMVISDRPVLYAALGDGAVSFDYANRNRDKLLRAMQRHLYEIYVVQMIDYEKGPRQHLDPSYRVEPLREFQNDASVFVRISRVMPAPDN